VNDDDENSLLQANNCFNDMSLNLLFGGFTRSVFKTPQKKVYLGVFKNRDTPKWMVKIMENPIFVWMIWGENPPFSETPIWKTTGPYGGPVVFEQKMAIPGKRRESRLGRRFQKNSPQRIRIRTVRMGSKKGSWGAWGSEDRNLGGVGFSI